jgi:hypothetical protein
MMFSFIVDGSCSAICTLSCELKLSCTVLKHHKSSSQSQDSSYLKHVDISANGGPKQLHRVSSDIATFSCKARNSEELPGLETACRKLCKGLFA